MLNNSFSQIINYSHQQILGIKGFSKILKYSRSHKGDIFFSQPYFDLLMCQICNKFQQIISLSQQMESQRYRQCQACQTANTTLNIVQQYNFYIICQYGHFLCPSCYSSTINEQNMCPIKHQNPHQIIKTEVPVKAFRLGKQEILIRQKVSELLNLGKPIIKIPIVMQQQQKIIEHLKAQIQQLKKRRLNLQAKRRLVNFILFMIVDTILSLIQLTSSVMQLFIMFKSINSNQFETKSFIFYFIAFVLTLLITHAKYASSSYFKCLLLFVFNPIFYLKLVFANQVKRCIQYCNFSAEKQSLTFESVNHSLMIGKTIVFLIFFARYYRILQTNIYLAVFVLSILEILASIGSDISYSLPSHDKLR